MTHDDEMIDELMRLVAAEIEVATGNKGYCDERFLSWLARDLRAGLSGEERRNDDLASSAFAKRASARIAARRTEETLPRRELRHRAAPIVGDASRTVADAARARCAAMLDLAVAAGLGRELWEEPCDQWLELPDDISPSEHYLALRVAGDSMSPVLEPRDVILIKLDGNPARGDLVVARVADHGYVVKHVASIANGRVELASFNPAYESVVVRRDRAVILGTVIARFKHE